MNAGKLLVSLHDVTPRHAVAVETILSELHALGLPPAVLLVVPDFHGRWALTDHPAFATRLGEWNSAGHQLALHGYFHLEQPEDMKRSRGAAAYLRRRFMTAGEGEFLSMDPERQHATLERGLEMWVRCGLEKPAGFVPPAWLHRPDLPSTLWKMGFSWTENHQGILFDTGSLLRSPVITWASRDAVRRIGSLAFAPLALRAWRHEPVLRIAIHPHDWDHPSLARSIRSTLRQAMRRRTPILGPHQV